MPSFSSEGVAFVGETSLTHGEVRLRAMAIAEALGTAGLSAGDRVALITSHRCGFYTCFAVCLMCGFPAVVIAPDASPQEIRLMLGRSSARALIADATVLQALSNDPNTVLPNVLMSVESAQMEGDRCLSASFEAPGEPVSPPSPVAANVSASASDASNYFSNSSLPGDIPAYILFTSGTTSRPKAVVISRGALINHIGTLARVFDYGRNARLLNFLPTYHTDGLVHGVAASLLTGMTAVQPGRFSATVDLAAVLRSNMISHFITVPTILAMIQRAHADQNDLFRYDGFECLISTAGFLQPMFWTEFQETYGVRIANFYGMTETVSGSLYCGPDDQNFRIGTLGKPIDAEVRIVDEKGIRVTAGAIGELQVSGAHLMSGYLDEPVATQTAIKDGWLSTGDLFFEDGDGFFRTVGRKKSIIKRGGVTVYPEDIRDVVAATHGVREVEVVGLPDSLLEEAIVVCAVVEPGVKAQDIRTVCQDRLGAERRPDRVVLFESLPRGPSGKVLHADLVEQLTPSAPPVAPPSGSISRRVLAVAAETFQVDQSALDESSSADTIANWDSFAGLGFILALERAFDLRLGPQDMLRMSTLGEAAEIISERLNKAREGL